MEKKTIEVPVTALLELAVVFRNVKLSTAAEIRANMALYAALGLDDVEDWLAANQLQSQFETEAAAHLALQQYEQKLAAKFPPGVKVAREVTAGVANTLRGYLDRMAEVFPAGKTRDGTPVSAGLPSASARKIGPLVAAVDDAFPPTS